MKLNTLHQLVESITIGTHNRLINNIHGDNIEEFIRDVVPTLNKQEVTSTARDRFGEMWPFEGISHVLRYGLARNYKAPLDSEHRQLQELLDKNKDRICAIYDKQSNSSFDNFYTTLTNFLTGYVKEYNTINHEVIGENIKKALYSGWLRHNYNSEQKQKVYTSILDEITAAAGVDANELSKRLSDQFNFNITQYHVQYIRGELKGDRNIDLEWWKEELATPWMIATLSAQSHTIAAQLLYTIFLKVFKGRDLYKQVWFFKKVKLLSVWIDDNKSVTRGNTEKVNSRFVDDNKQFILSIIGDPTLTVTEQSKILNDKYKGEAPFLFSLPKIKQIRQTYISKNLKTFTFGLTPLQQKLLAIADEIKDKLQYLSVTKVLDWLDKEHHIKASSATLVNLGLHQPTPRAQWRKQLLPYAHKIKELSDDGKSHEFICRWISHEINLNISTTDLNHFLNSYSVDNQHKINKFDRKI